MHCLIAAALLSWTALHTGRWSVLLEQVNSLPITDVSVAPIIISIEFHCAQRTWKPLKVGRCLGLYQTFGFDQCCFSTICLVFPYLFILFTTVNIQYYSLVSTFFFVVFVLLLSIHGRHYVGATKLRHWQNIADLSVDGAVKLADDFPSHLWKDRIISDCVPIFLYLQIVLLVGNCVI